MAKAVNTVEYQGYHGNVTVSERVLQKIWLRRDFREQGLSTLGGKRVSVRQPGRWNLQEGPDFREAEISLDGQVNRGDVEIHFYPQDWFLHGHDRDPHFDRVALHVCLFPPRHRGNPAVTSGGNFPETVVLLDHLEHDLESYAADDALIELERQSGTDVLEVFLQDSLEARLESLYERAGRRWRQKVAFARKRLEGNAWEEACHQFALEVLGYRRNRGPMSMLGEQHAIADFSQYSADRLFAKMEGRWRLAGLRPPNHPRKRLAQYLALLRHDPAWPEALLTWGQTEFTELWEPLTSKLRKQALASARKRLAEELLGSTIGGSRLDTLTIDALLPLLAAKTGADLFPAWFHWWAGDMPASLTTLLRQGEVIAPGRPAANGWYQGGLQLLLESGL